MERSSSHRVSLGIATGVALAILMRSDVSAQAPNRERDVARVIDQLFAAMRASDTAATRAAFVANARVIPIAPNGTVETAGRGLSVDQFTTFVGRNASGTW